MYRWTLLVAVCATGLALAQPLAEFWKPGQVRELLLGDLPNTAADLQEWAACGVNCAAGVPAEKAHAAMMKARTWFTMDYMDSRNMPLADIEKRAARREDGSVLRPVDPLFPTVGQYGYTACVNNPSWREFAGAAFRKAAESGFDGVHVDFASHYERCFCPHCAAAWEAFGRGHDLAGIPLAQAEHSSDFRVQMLLREFRIGCVMDFLGFCRGEARQVRPGYCLDGTYHQDSGSTFQWQYGDHFELMCIEGTTWGAFPPASQQIVWLKTARGLSRGRVPMSVTYHLLRDGGEFHHGRMAADRVEVALAEIMSQGAVSWLGLGGPKTGSLLKEHQQLVKRTYRFFADNEAVVREGRPRAQVALLFSPKSYLVTGLVRNAVYVLGEALMKAHVPFTVLGDRDLTAAQLQAYPVVVALPAPVLSDATVAALRAYVEGGGRLLYLGEQGKYDEQYRARPAACFPAALLADKSQAKATCGRGEVVRWGAELLAPQALGAAQSVTLDQQQPAPLAIEGFSKAQGVAGEPDSNYSLYVDLTYQDGSSLWGQVATFATGTHDWEFARSVIKPTKPVKAANVHLLLRNRRGTVWFRDVRFGPWDEAAGQITRNLLGSKLNPAVDEVYDASPGQTAGVGVWTPYAGGFQVETVAGRPTVRISSSQGLLPGFFPHYDPVVQETVMAPLEALLQGRRELRLTGPDGVAQVYAEVSDLPGSVAVQLVNYNCTLHPELPELEQQKADVALGVAGVRVAVRLPEGRQATGAELRMPGQAPQPLAVATAEGMATVTVPQLRTYALVVVNCR